MWLRSLHPRILSPSLSRLHYHPTRACLRFYSDATTKSAPPPPITKVEKLVLDSIKATGPIPFATYMQLCLSHPTHGYYTNPNHAVFGTRGDFTTSPEISQVFGEIIGIWFLSQWVSAGKPERVRLVELGPGRGTLMSDILRVISQVTKSVNPVRAVHLVETSRPLREQQAVVLERRVASRSNLHWHDAVDEVPPAPDTYTMLVAHEFFDALPVHVLQKTQQGWNEVLVASSLEPLKDPRRAESTTPDSTDLDSETAPDSAMVYPRLRRVLSPAPTGISTVLGASSPRFQAMAEGTTIEVSPAAYRIGRKVGEMVAGGKRETGVDEAAVENNVKGTVGGCGLIVDYGGAKVHEDSFRAFKNHEIVDVFHRPGECDLTTNVDFAFLSEAMGDLVKTHGPISQRTFLTRMGLDVRMEALALAAEGDKEREGGLKTAAKRLVDPLGMGAEYRFMGITSGKEADEVWPFVEQLG
ncbi:S-adenosyl-L-methionine-dependent methyltransferase [Collybia nuda]|uniref:Protein arginine methyltransferase NDUFAF7 n=1 Tax=Collybia nuda TaxID=64659 RepID=A0A9P5YDC8_9AGAR|nr:S-adenosyl-L-methionine-dependent methyltransferase [Collybia nuda]